MERKEEKRKDIKRDKKERRKGEERDRKAG